MTALNKISKLVQNQFPDFYKEEGPKFLAFIEAYYEYLEQTGKLNDRIQNLKSYADISTTTDEFIDFYLKSFLPSVPVEVTGDKKIMTKYVKYFNQSRGTLGAYKLLFRSIFNEDIDVEYPSESILKVSDGDWRQDRYLNAPFDSANYRFIGKTIVGSESRAEALVETVLRKVVNGRDLQQIILSNIRGFFQDGERIFEKGKEGDHSTLIEGGIKNLQIIAQGSRYVPGDVVKLISNNRGDYGKAVVSQTIDLGGVVEFNILDGGSGYSPSIDAGGTEITVELTDADSPASFSLVQNSLENTYALVVKTPLIGSNTLFGEDAPTIGSTQLSQFNDMLLSSPNFGFAEDGEQVTEGADFRTNTDAMINLANTYQFTVGDKLYGVTSGANAEVTAIVDTTDGDCWLKLDTYKNFDTAETVRRTTSSGLSVGTVTEFQANTIGQFRLQVGLDSAYNINVGDELVGLQSGAFGVVKYIVVTEAGQYEHQSGGSSTFRDLLTLKVSANTSANLTTQFDAGPMRSFEDEEGIRVVGSSTVIANVAGFTTNTSIENIYTRIGDALQSEEKLFGTIAVLAEKVSGAGYTVQPDVTVIEPEISALGIGEQYLTIQYDDVNFGSGISVTVLDTNDRVLGQTSRASGDIKGGYGSAAEVSRSQYANGTYESIIRVWQDYLQRSPGNKYFANNETITIYHHTSAHIPGNADNRTPAGTGSAQIVKIEDRGILGKNANITTSVGANGAITNMRVLDSGFAYVDGETVTVESNDRVNSTQATVKLTVDGVANTQGFYGTTRSHISSLRGYIHDGKFYQEYSYQAISPITLNRYKDIALSLVHPAGQALFGKFRTQSSTDLNVSTSSIQQKRIKADGTISISKTAASGTIAITNGQNVVRGTTTDFLTEFGQREIPSPAGSVTVHSGNTTVIGDSDTRFTNYQIGDRLLVGQNNYRISDIANNNVMSVQFVNLLPGASANSDYSVNKTVDLIIEIDTGDNIKNQFIPVQFTANSATTGNLKQNWIFGTQTSANIYYANSWVITGTSTNFDGDFDDGATMYVETSYTGSQYQKIRLNSVESDTVANSSSIWVLEDVSSANIYYISES